MSNHDTLTVHLRSVFSQTKDKQQTSVSCSKSSINRYKHRPSMNIIHPTITAPSASSQKHASVPCTTQATPQKQTYRRNESPPISIQVPQLGKQKVNCSAISPFAQTQLELFRLRKRSPQQSSNYIESIAFRKEHPRYGSVVHTSGKRVNTDTYQEFSEEPLFLQQDSTTSQSLNQKNLSLSTQESTPQIRFLNIPKKSYVYSALKPDKASNTKTATNSYKASSSNVNNIADAASIRIISNNTQLSNYSNQYQVALSNSTALQDLSNMSVLRYSLNSRTSVDFTAASQLPGSIQGNKIIPNNHNNLKEKRLKSRLNTPLRTEPSESVSAVRTTGNRVVCYSYKGSQQEKKVQNYIDSLKLENNQNNSQKNLETADSVVRLYSKKLSERSVPLRKRRVRTEVDDQAEEYSVDVVPPYKNQTQSSSRIESKQSEVIDAKSEYEMTDEEWNSFGNRFPESFKKLRLLGRGGFSMVWLGQHASTKRCYAVKQILTENKHQTHLKEISFACHFFDSNQQPKHGLESFQGLQNLSKLLAYEATNVDTWLIYELGGDSLGNGLYELVEISVQSLTNEVESVTYRLNYRELYLEMRRNSLILKQLIVQLAQAIEVISEQGLVHCDVKTENVLIKAKRDERTSRIVGVEEVKLIDYGSAFRFNNLKGLSMTTPEYMAPEVLNYILSANNKATNMNTMTILQYQQENDRNPNPWVIDMWSLGCVVLELIHGIPLWMSKDTQVLSIKTGAYSVHKGLFAVEHREFDQIINKQIETVQRLDEIIKYESYSGLTVDATLRQVLTGMLKVNPSERFSPQDVFEILAEDIERFQ